MARHLHHSFQIGYRTFKLIKASEIRNLGFANECSLKTDENLSRTFIIITYFSCSLIKSSIDKFTVDLGPAT